jgi:PAS domain-containing protein
MNKTRNARKRRAPPAKPAAQQRNTGKMPDLGDPYVTIFSSNPDAIYLVDLELNVLMANPGAARLLGFENAEELIGRNMTESAPMWAASSSGFFRFDMSSSLVGVSMPK